MLLVFLSLRKLLESNRDEKRNCTKKWISAPLNIFRFLRTVPVFLISSQLTFVQRVYAE